MVKLELCRTLVALAIFSDCSMATASRVTPMPSMDYVDLHKIAVQLPARPLPRMKYWSIATPTYRFHHSPSNASGSPTTVPSTMRALIARSACSASRKSSEVQPSNIGGLGVTSSIFLTKFPS